MASMGKPKLYILLSFFYSLIVQASREDQMLHGLNYASAAVGILDVTGRNFVGRIPFNEQLRNFEDTLDKITDNLGAPDVAQALARCMFFVEMGNNDYLNNYLMPTYPTQNQYNGQQYADLLIQKYTGQLTRLYNLGARKVVIGGLGLLGCIPSILSQSDYGHCSEEVNQLVLPFNTNLKTMASSTWALTSKNWKSCRQQRSLPWDLQ